MGIFGTKRIKRLGPGRYRVTLPEAEQDLLRTLVPQLRDLLTTDDPSLTRLFPTAYADDPERDAGYHALVRDELLERRFAALDALESTIEGGEVDEEQLSAWMRALNDLRLVLGTRLDVSEDDDPMDLRPGDPESAAWAIYHYLGALQGMVVDALTQDL
ncbi:MAG: DUF2017 family protein [Acidimicrobiia bacterium]